MLGSLLDVLFPRRCAGCGTGPWPYCQACGVGLVRFRPPGCVRCGRPRDAPGITCRDCPPAGLSAARAAFLYEGPARRALIRLKFGSARVVAPALAAAMVEALVRWPPPGWERLFDPLDEAIMGRSQAPPVVTWVPLGRARRRRRGFDQAQALATVVAGVLEWPVRRLLVRAVETAPQARRMGAERRLALQGAFRAAGGAPGRVLLVDDVLTTGWTASTCGDVLRGAGAGQVVLLTAARSLGGPLPARCYDPRGLSTGSVVARGTSLR
jgi:predicted amidophosphoribosyltransferase